MSSKKDFLFDHHIVAGVYPVADMINVSCVTDYINLRDYRRITFLITTGVSTGGTSNATVTLAAATDNAGAGATTLGFRYKVCASSTTVDTWGASTVATATGFSMTAASNYKYIVEVLVEELQAALAGAKFCALTCTEVTNDPIVGAIEILLSEPRYPQPVPLTAIA